MTAEQIRARLVEYIDAILDAPWIVRQLMRAEHLRMLKAQRRFWLEAPVEILQRILTVLEQEPVQAKSKPAAGEEVAP